MRYRRAPVLWRRCTDRLLVAPADSGLVSTLQGSAMSVWDALDVPHSVEELADLLSSTFTASPGRIRDDLEPALTDLVQLGVLEEVD